MALIRMPVAAEQEDGTELGKYRNADKHEQKLDVAEIVTGNEVFGREQIEDHELGADKHDERRYSIDPGSDAGAGTHEFFDMIGMGGGVAAADKVVKPPLAGEMLHHSPEDERNHQLKVEDIKPGAHTDDDERDERHHRDQGSTERHERRRHRATRLRRRVT